MKSKQPDWSIILPTLDEGENLGPLLHALLRLPIARRAEFIIADGGSTDHTRDAYLQAAKKHSNLRWLEVPPGKGLALRIGFAKSKGRYLAFMDADGQYPPVALANVCRALESGADLVLTRRRPKHADHLRRALSLGYAHVVGRGLLDLPSRDPQSGLKAVRRPLLSKLNLTARHWDLDAQLIAQAERAGAKIKEVDIDFLPRAHGHTKTDVLGTSSNLLAGALKQSFKR